MIERRDRLFDGQVVLLGLNSRQQLVLDGFELRARERALGEQDLAVVARLGGALAGVLLLDLLIEVVELGAPVEGRRSCVWRSNSTRRSPFSTGAPPLMSLVMTSDCEFGPDSLGAATVVDSTASTVPLSRTDRTKSCRVTVAVVCAPAGLSEFGTSGSRPRMSAAPVATLTRRPRSLSTSESRSWEASLLRLSDGRPDVLVGASGFRHRRGRGHSTGTLNRGQSRVNVPQREGHAIRQEVCAAGSLWSFAGSPAHECVVDPQRRGHSNVTVPIECPRPAP